MCVCGGGSRGGIVAEGGKEGGQAASTEKSRFVSDMGTLEIRAPPGGDNRTPM